MDFFDELVYRGLVKDVTDLEGFKDRLKTPVTLYCGIDPSADSMHVGHLQQIILLKRYQNEGHQPIALCGGATGMIGDPRPTTERKLLNEEEISYNVECLKRQLKQFINFSKGAILVNNYDWTKDLSIIDFLRDYGKYFNVSYMINKDIVASRLDKGISYTEFSYTILQALDWLHLYRNYNCEIQIGGSDQWGNLTSGSELIRKVIGDKAKVFGITSPLLTRSDGGKFGKSEGNNIWLDANKTNAYEFYQFWINTPDADIIDYIKRLSFININEIESLIVSTQQQAHLRLAQKMLANELTALVHGEEGLASAIRISDTLFSGDITTLSYEELTMALKGMKTYVSNADKNVVDLLVEVKAASSKREARELLNGGSIMINNQKVSDLMKIISKDDALFKQYTIIRKGKKNYFVIIYE